MVPLSLLQSALVAALLQGTLQIPAPVGLVNDFAQVIPAANASQIEQIANDVRTKSPGEIAVVTLPDIGDRAASDVALQIFRQWKVGRAGNPGDTTRNVGAVILIVPKESSSIHRGDCWVTTGYGSEGFITDADVGSICRQAVPFFQAKQYGAGTLLVTYLTAQQFAKEYQFTVDTTFAPAGANAPVSEPVTQPSDGGGFPPQLIFLAIVFIFLFLGSFRRGRRGGCGGCLPIFLPFGGGGFGGFGGGGFGGGGWGGGGFGGGGGGFGGFGGGGGSGGGGGGASW